MKRTNLFFLLISTIHLSSCRKDNIVVDPNYVGIWTSGGTCADFIRINSDGSGSYWVIGGPECGDDSHTDDDIQSNGKSFKIGSMKFKIITPPTVMDTIIQYCGFCGNDVYFTEYMVLKKGIFHNNNQIKLLKIGPDAP